MSYVCSCFLLLLIAVVRADEDIIEKFVPTSEWAVIREGQSIGKGLHVRLNLQTGIKEAKLLSEEDQNSSGASENMLTVRDDNVVGVVKDVDSIEEGLKKVASSTGDQDTVSKKFRTIDELKKIMPNMEMKTEGQELKHKVEILGNVNKSDTPSLIIALEALEDMAHKYDNGKLLVSQGWMVLLKEHLYHQDVEVYKATLRVLSSAAQSNPSVQSYLLQSGYLDILVSKILSQPERVAKSTIMAVSAMVRNLPAGLGPFRDIHGYNTISTKFGVSSLGPLQRAILAFYNDLLDQDVRLESREATDNLRTGGHVLCKKLSDILSDSGKSIDVLQESILFFSKTKHWCEPEVSEKTSRRIKELTEENDELSDMVKPFVS